MNDPQILETLKNLVDELNLSKLNDEKVDRVRLIGQTAAFFGGFDGMTKLHDAFEKTGGDTYKLNRLWDCVGGWMA